MRLSRRRLLAASLAIPVVVGAERAVRSIGDALRGMAAAVRPPAAGTSATRCAQCGAADHTMLDLRCPAAPKVA